jgi:hypothetical protein
MRQTQPWLANPLMESIFILSPAILPVALILIFRNYFTTGEVTTLWWMVLVLGVDVSHVYSTFFRMYWDKKTFQAYKHLLLIIPITGFVVALSVHLYDAMLFWRLLAYVAVYHFIRQQYGFMRLYSRKESADKLRRTIDAAAIYSATIYPILYWHMTGTEKIAWFVKGDFIKLDWNEYDWLLSWLYLGILVIYMIKEFILSIREKTFNIPKNLILIGTYISWYAGIVAFQGDLIFTLLNVVAHGIPYMALIWLHGEKRASTHFSFGMKGATIFVVILLALAYFEENLWDNFVWNDHPEIFVPIVNAPLESSILLSALVAFLVIPQITHYVLDGFIWRFSKDSHARI